MTPLCSYFLKQKYQAPYYLHHSFQRLNTSHVIYIYIFIMKLPLYTGGANRRGVGGASNYSYQNVHLL